MKKGIPMTPRTGETVKIWSYGESEGDFHAENIRIGNGEIVFDLVTPSVIISDISPGIPVKINVENSVAAAAAALLCGVTPDEVKEAIHTFQGAGRRFDFHIKSDRIVFIDDYAHHPRELSAAITSIKALYDDKKITAVFQPHLYSRTRDFALEFADSFSLLDDVGTAGDIYHAREEPIEGVYLSDHFR
jgi:UDP-N-acetylmuramate--alanine ligase